MAGAVMEYVAYWAEFVLFGGFNETTVFSNTWCFSQYADDWFNASMGTHPPPRGLASIIPESGGDGFYMFGGVDASGSILKVIAGYNYYNDTWLYTPIVGWVDLTTSISPPARAGAFMVLDGNGTNILLSGGVGMISSSLDVFDDTWTFSPALDHWTLGSQVLGGTTPLLGCGTFNTVSRNVAYTGGWGAHGSGNASWQWSLGGTWTSLPKLGGPTPPAFAAMGCVWDPALNGTVVYGGMDASPLGVYTFSTFNTTYLLKEVGWSLSAPEDEPFLSGTPFPLTASAVGPSGLPWTLNLSFTLYDSSGTLSPHSVNLDNGTGTVSAVVWIPDLSDVVTACQWEACVNMSLSIHGPATNLSITDLPGTIRAGAVANVSVTVNDATGKTAWWWSGTALACVIPGGNLFSVTITDGNGTIPLTWTHPGTFTLAVTASRLQEALQNFTVVPGGLSLLTVSIALTTIQVGKGMSVTIQAHDAYGNPVSMPELNITDTLGDFAPVQIPVANGAANVTVTIGNKTGEDNITVSAAGIRGESNSFNVEGLPPLPTPSHNPGTDWLPVEIGVVVAAMAVAVATYILYMRRKKRKEEKEEPEVVGPLAFLPIGRRDDAEKRDSRGR
jgi:hypothetical protein